VAAGILIPWTIKAIVPFSSLLTGLVSVQVKVNLPIIGISIPVECLVGGSIIAAGLYVYSSAKVAQKKALAASPAQDAPQSLISEVFTTQGIYQYSRNPIFLAACLIQGGFAVLANNPFQVGATVLSALFFHSFAIPAQEQRMSNKFGQPYKSYQSSVPRWFQGIPL
jgi:protein-S-isoprenylcysteine O-methyltransferase Ste14